MRVPYRFLCVMLLVGASCVLAAGSPGKDLSGSVKFDAAQFEQGKTTKIDDPATGGNGFWLLYLPSDYTPAKRWPTIFCYHGRNVQTTVFPFKEMTDGKGYIVVGMDFLDREAREPQTGKNLANLHRIHDLLAAKLKIDESLLFVGGVSQGGFRSSDYFDAESATWAGAILLDAGRGVDSQAGTTTSAAFHGKAVYIGDGEKDQYVPMAKEAAEIYKKRGADVTFELWPGLGHSVQTKSPVLRQWLRDHGPLVSARASMAAATAAEKAGTLGQAHALYDSVARDAADEKIGSDAKARASSIVQQAEKDLAQIESDLAAKNYSAAIKSLTLGSRTYAGCDWGQKMAARLKSIESDSAIQGEIAHAKIDAAADIAEQAAQKLDAARQFKQAIAAYEAYVAKYPQSHHIDAVRQRLTALKADKSIQATMANQQVDADCKSWLGMARNYARMGSSDQARTYLQKIIGTYPDSTYAQTAKQEMEHLK